MSKKKIDKKKIIKLLNESDKSIKFYKAVTGINLPEEIYSVYRELCESIVEEKNKYIGKLLYQVIILPVIPIVEGLLKNNNMSSDIVMKVYNDDNDPIQDRIKLVNIIREHQLNDKILEYCDVQFVR